MTEYRNLVEWKRKQLAAEEWAKGVSMIHAHKLDSMWYDTRPEDTKNGGVTDTQYNDGSIERILSNGGIVYFNERKLTGDELIDAWEKATYNQCICGIQNCPDEYTHITHGF